MDNRINLLSRIPLAIRPRLISALLIFTSNTHKLILVLMLSGLKKKRRLNGFTIVELLIVIVVISILASITVVSFNNVQKSARDAIRKTDLNNISKTLNIHAISNNGDMFGHDSGCGAGGNGSGWWYSTEEHYNNMSTRDCLVQAGFSQVANINDPSGCYGGAGEQCIGKPRYMVIHCSVDGVNRGYLLAQLETEDQDTTFTDSLCDSGTSPGFVAINAWDTDYGINYKVRLY